ncbi:hypothetical protein ACHAW5_003872 [Stephanodiscus triporus]|uniref:Uncharacterized protein n=1 Tax=Stephanodiscus triporus TaxID=2934178 RepID=A0ABD3MRQ8_9STRA
MKRKDSPAWETVDVIHRRRADYCHNEIHAPGILPSDDNDNDRGPDGGGPSMVITTIASLPLLLALYTLQGIPGTQRQHTHPDPAEGAGHHVLPRPRTTRGGGSRGRAQAAHHPHSLADLTKIAYNAQGNLKPVLLAFSLKLYTAPIVDACFSKAIRAQEELARCPCSSSRGRSWWEGDYVEREFGLGGAATAGVM